ncbi:hypothetical protein ACFXOD_36460 [Streptomyces sp. NPDC059161]|uniref:hypothetical protein n=1 Tax=Streptomyces sp. NPDC059161 TaxID=3346749 RepID=UPI003674A802
MNALGEVRAMRLVLDAGAWIPTATDQLLAKLVEADLSLVTVERIRAALTEVGQASGPLADALKQAKAALTGITPTHLVPA